MAAGSKIESLENLFEIQDKERLLEINLYVSGDTKYKGRESGALSVLNKLRLEGEAGFCDVTLGVEGRQLTTHRCVLAANSPFFYTMFSSGMKDSSQKVLSLQSVGFTSMSLILDYFYTREIVINDENVLDLLNASSFLLVTPVKNACIQLLTRKLGSDNCFSVLQVAEQFGADELAKRANDYIKTNFFIVINNEEFVSISQKDLVRFISSDDIQVEKEEEIYQSVLKWVKHDEANRVAVLPELLKHLRKDSLPKGFLEFEMEREPLLMATRSDGNPAPKKTRKRKGAKRSKKGKNEKSVPELRPSTEMRNVMIGIGNGDNQRAFCYDMDEKELHALADLSIMQFSPQVAFVGRTLYLVGGQKYNNECVKRVNAMCFDDVKKLRFSANIRMGVELKGKMPCEEARLKASLVSFDQRLYYIGGWNVQSDQCSNTVVCYNPEMDNWYPCAELNTARCKSGCVATEKYIFLIGGGTTLAPFNILTLSSVEKYDPEMNSWSYVAPLNKARSSPGCVYNGGKIYVIGGIDSGGFQSCSCEVYSPITNQWEAIAQLPYPHCGVNNVIVVKNQVTVPLKLDTTDFSCDAVKYSTRSKKWQKVKNLGPSDKITSFTLCTMKLPVLILQRMSREYFPDEFFREWKISDDEDWYSESDESSSFFGWNSGLSDSGDMMSEDGDIDIFF